MNRSDREELIDSLNDDYAEIWIAVRDGSVSPNALAEITRHEIEAAKRDGAKSVIVLARAPSKWQIQDGPT